MVVNNPFINGGFTWPLPPTMPHYEVYHGLPNDVADGGGEPSVSLGRGQHDSGHLSPAAGTSTA